MHHQQIRIAGGQHAGANTDRGAGKECVGGRLYRVGQLHASDFIVLRRAEHARVGVGSLRHLCGLRQDDLLAVKARFFHIDDPVEGRKFLACDALAGIEHRVESFPRMVSKTGALVQAFDSQPVVEQELDASA